MLEVVAAGLLSTIQDKGRGGYQHLGVPRSGALDQPALDLANRLVGNAPDAAGLELSHGRFAARFDRPVAVAVTGAPAPVWAGSTPAAFGMWLCAKELRIGTPTHGTHTYLAVQGGINVVPVLGSRSTDTLSGLGPPPLKPGDRLPLGDAGDPRDVDFTPAITYGEETRVRVHFGPHHDWFADPAQLIAGTFRISTGNRIGVRLTGPVIKRRVDSELASVGLVAGAVQVPRNGQPIVFLADHPTTGGYPIIAVVHPHDLPLIAQARPGTRVVFRGP